MQRRKFIQKTLTGLPIVLVAPSILASACNADEVPKDKTILVIGAGISGLAAAKKLQDKGYTVIVLEAQDKVGGRMRTNRSLGPAFDEGASWIHGIDGNPITALAQQASMTTFETLDESRKSYDVGGVLRSATTFDDAEEELYTILETMMNNGNANQSFETVFNALYPAKANDRLWKFLLSTYVTFDTGDLDQLSSLLYHEGEEYGGIEKIATIHVQADPLAG